MLVLSRKISQAITISDNIRVTVLSVDGNRVRLGIEAPKNLVVMRAELIGKGGLGQVVGEPFVPNSPDVTGAAGERLSN
jgi:carbon storage regulator